MNTLDKALELMGRKEKLNFSDSELEYLEDCVAILEDGKSLMPIQAARIEAWYEIYKRGEK